MPFRRIVIGVDFGTASLAAVRWVARDFASDAQILVVHVASEPRTPEFLRSHFTSGDCLDQTASMYGGLRGLADLMGPGRLDVDVSTGLPADELARAAEDFGADLICVGKSRRRRGSGRFGATTPQRLVARTTLPVLVVPEGVRARPATVLVAVSGSSESGGLLRAAARIATGCDARLDVLYAVEPEVQEFARIRTHGIVEDADALSVAHGDQHVGDTSVEALNDAQLRLLARRWMQDQIARLQLPANRATAMVRLGDAGEATIAHATQSGIGLVIVGPRRQDEPGRGSGRLGSTAALAMWAAPCPVLVAAPEPQPRSGRRGARSRIAMSRSRHHSTLELMDRGLRVEGAAEVNDREKKGPPFHRSR